MKIAIIGGAGFIGTHLTYLLKHAGHEVRLLDVLKSEDFPVETLIVNVEDRAALIENLKQCDVIYNLAAEHRDDVSPVERYYAVNVRGAENIVAAAEANGIKTIIFNSTVAVYGLDGGESCERDTPAPFNDYAKSKLEAEGIFNRWVASNAQNSLVTLRLVATFGPRNRGNIYTLMKQIASGKFIMIGAGKNHKSVAYVKNVAAFLQHCLSFGAGSHLYNYADKPDLNMREMVRGIRQALGKKGLGLRLPYLIGLLGGRSFDVLAKLTGKIFPISAIRVQKFCANTVVNTDKLEATGFARPYSLHKGLNEMIAAEFKS
ncbi:MAG: NAD-dependent epimerase/dehydratase family protein [Pseudohongiella sp.]|nr:NAD-dependent epimerase/dehydratase family protein [Pseudohongiella sp.]